MENVKSNDKRGRRKRVISDKTFGERFARLVGTDISYNALSQKIGIARQVLSGYGNSESLPDCENLRKIAKYFNVSADYLLGLSGVKSPEADDKAIHTATGLGDSAISELRASWQVLQVQADSKEITAEYIHAKNTIEGINFLLGENNNLDPVRVLDFIADYRACDGKDYVIASTDGKHAKTVPLAVLKQAYLALIGGSIDGGVK